ncbi:MAG: hypothetical protein F4X17_22490 [Gemmatimonadetes bacterium]|nr:hypothetical protein [Gemmatimonadota bacterium]MYI63916.1 hypothetical protein [Gemmatimonadota bacterium]
MIVDSISCRLGIPRLVWISTLLIFPFQAWSQQGHAIRGNQVLIDRAAHWQAWKGASSLLDISTADNTVRPSFIRKEVNAAQNATQFSTTGEGGVITGSVTSAANNLIDGDLQTMWGPNPESPLEDWWAEVNLGRVVVVKKIVVRFAQEGEGDPFLQFKVLGWRQPPPRSVSGYYLDEPKTNVPNFWEIGRTDKPNKTQRVFEFEPRPTEGSDRLFRGDPLERILIIALNSDSTKAEELTEQEYENLPTQQQGAIEFYRKERSGRETLISQAEYDSIDPERQGPIRYYRREIPKIAEIEVVTEGDNVNIGVVERGGQVTIETNSGIKDIGSTVADGNYSTGVNGSIFGYRDYNYFEDLGALFWVDTMHFLTDGASPINELYVDVSDGTRAPDGSIKWTRVGQSTSRDAFGHTASGGLRFREIQIELSKIRFIRSPFQNPLSSLSYIAFTEVMLYGEGFVAEVSLTSDLIQFNEPKNLISVEWEADTPPGTQVQLQTRTGNELIEEKIYHDSNGKVVTEKRYNKLPKSKKGDITSTFKPGDDWSTWSVPHTQSGEAIKSPSPRQYMELRLTLLTDRADAGATLRSIAINTSDPVADRLVGEVWPTRIETVGTSEEFSYFIRPDFTATDQGFDEISLEATAGTEMELLEVRTGSTDDFANGQTTNYAPANLTLIDTPAGSLRLRLDDKIDRGTDLVQVRFRATIFGNSASFRALVQNSAIPGFWQRVDEGDPTELVSSQTVTVLALSGDEIIRDFKLGSQVFTPNGDGVNDELVVSFGVARVGAERPVTLTVYDLSGVETNRLEERRSDPRGNYVFRWDGKDRLGEPVPPGIYLARVKVDVDSGSADNTFVQRVVHVAY